MITRKTSQDNRPEEDEKSSEHYVHHPEFVILEDESKAHAYAGGKESKQYYDFISHLKQVDYPPLFRIFTLGLSWVVFLFSFVLLIALAGAAVLALLGGFMNDELNRPVKLFWKIYSHMLVFSLGLFVACFNPPFGFSLILLFYMLHGESLDDGFIARIFKSHIMRN